MKDNTIEELEMATKDNKKYIEELIVWLEECKLKAPSWAERCAYSKVLEKLTKEK